MTRKIVYIVSKKPKFRAILKYRSFIETRNKNCPKIEPFVTPCFMEVKKEV